MTLSEVKELIELVSQKGFAEFEVERSGFKLRIVANWPPQGAFVQQHAAPAQQATTETHQRTITTSSTPAVQQAPPAPVETPPVEVESDSGLQIVKSPIVGTFYKSPSPTAEPFVKVGDNVAAGDVLCIVEAMKLMNEIESEFSGEIVKIFVENGTPVEYGQPLFGIRA